MSDLAIRVENLSKCYRINAIKRRYHTLRDQLTDSIKGLLRRNGQLRPEQDILWALRDVSFEVRSGEIIGIIGRNGAGKSTLLKILSRITEPTSGQAEIYGRVASLLEVGTGFHSELTGRENIYLNGAILGMSRAEINRKFDEIVSFSGVERFIDTPVKHYSSGMKVRLAFAVAAHLEPEILLIDEVLAVGDAAFQKKCLWKMGDVVKEGRTVLFVSHNMAMITNLCQRAILLHNGSLAEEGLTNRVIDRYLMEMSSLSNTSLAERTDRRGFGEIFSRAIELLDYQGNRIEYPVSGQELTIRLHYQSKVEKMFKNCRVSLAVHKDGHGYIIMSTDLVSTKQLNLYGSSYIDFVVPEFPLSAGIYYLSSYIEANGGVQDLIEMAYELSVVDGDFYGTGRNYPHQSLQGKFVLVKYCWRLGDNRSAFEETD